MNSKPATSKNPPRSSRSEKRSRSGREAQPASITIASAEATDLPADATLDRRGFEALRSAIERIRRTGSAETVTVTVRPAGGSVAADRRARTGSPQARAAGPVRLVGLPGKTEARGGPKGRERQDRAAPETVLDKARERGAARAAAILAGPEMLSADEFAGVIGVTRETVHQKRRRGEVLGMEGVKRGYKFPRWQVTGDGRLLAGLPAIVEALGGHSWAVFRFLLQPHEPLGGATGVEALRAGRVDEVINLAPTRDGYA